ncbi:glycerol-3-phosphate dehydrogenase/oxidase [Psychromonas sp. L1A2]|uniref:glycerol-3-phosphate dehydrogenase/oxidase n=1 Tax=Psychromonas sp. L1A2 TaxID=2686356 RepID=UPI00135B72E2|nr:FAD-dependent oxidoreductase [Psychromonas sp. L1A2]
MSLNRTNNIKQLAEEELDVLILGGGINGAVAAASLAAKGVKVGLIDKGDFAGATSSNSSNLAWGGIKYLESHEYRLVNKLCKSRNNLMKHYPSSVTEVRFLTTIQKGFRFPVWFVFMGTLAYWLFGRLFTMAPKYLTRNTIKQLEPSIKVTGAQAGFEYSDAFLKDNDSRFVFNFITAAAKKSALVANYVESVNAVRENDQWVIQAKDKTNGQAFTIKAKTLINACGPLVDQVNKGTKQKTSHHHLFSKGVHLTVDRISKEHRVLAFFASDGRLFFVLPMGSKTCIGTTDNQVESHQTSVTDEDRQFILDNANTLLELDKPLTKDDIIAERCGVRPLAIEAEEGVADWVALSRKHAIDVNKADKHISIFGGKLTDCINVGDEVADIIEDLEISMNRSDALWYGEPADQVKAKFMGEIEEFNIDKLTPKGALEPLSSRFWRRYGEDAFVLVEAIKQNPAKANLALEHTEFTWAEIDWVAENEMIVNLDDLLRRRSKATLVIRKELLDNAEGLEAISKRLFGDDAQQKMDEFRGRTNFNRI